MHKTKIKFGKIQLNVPDKNKSGGSSAGNLFLRTIFTLAVLFLFILQTGFGTFGKTIPTKIIESEEDEATEADNKQMAEIMGITSFGKKAQSFDITVSFAAVYDRFFCLFLLSFYTGTNS